MTLGDFLSDSVKGLGNLYPEREAENIAYILCEEILGKPHYFLFAHPEYEIPSTEGEILSLYLDRLKTSEPLQYVLGFAEFYSRRFRVSSDVLIPRPETELLVERILRFIGGRRGLRVLDLCTGSGCIAWTIALEAPGTVVTAVDISSEAISIAASQPFEAEAAPRFVEGDIFDESLPESLGKFDIVVSNPPYVMESQKKEMRRNVLEWEPEAAIFVKDSEPLVFYEAVSSWCDRVLVPGGAVAVELNDRLEEPTKKYFSKKSYFTPEVIYAMDGLPRHIFAEKLK